MESNGKSVTKNGQQVDYQTGVCHHPQFVDNELILFSQSSGAQLAPTGNIHFISSCIKGRS